jgi:hypothetical protein
MTRSMSASPPTSGQVDIVQINPSWAPVGLELAMGQLSLCSSKLSSEVGLNFTASDKGSSCTGGLRGEGQRERLHWFV